MLSRNWIVSNLLGYTLKVYLVLAVSIIEFVEGTREYVSDFKDGRNLDARSIGNISDVGGAGYDTMITLSTVKLAPQIRQKKVAFY